MYDTAFCIAAATGLGLTVRAAGAPALPRMVRASAPA
jgi:hypothetical protein